jgi:hypothetical protein
MSEWLDMKEYDFDVGHDEYTFGPLNIDLTEQDNVNNPAHYGQGRIEAIEYIEDFMTREEFIGYLRGNIAKYMHRFRYKNGLEDVEKAKWYMEALIEVLREGET